MHSALDPLSKNFNKDHQINISNVHFIVRATKFEELAVVGDGQGGNLLDMSFLLIDAADAPWLTVWVHAAALSCASGEHDQ